MTTTQAGIISEIDRALDLLKDCSSLSPARRGEVVEIIRNLSFAYRNLAEPPKQ